MSASIPGSKIAEILVTAVTAKQRMTFQSRQGHLEPAMFYYRGFCAQAHLGGEEERNVSF